MSRPAKSILVWFRLDLRLDDNPVLTRAVETGRPVIPCFVWSPEDEGAWAPGCASRWWLHRSLDALGESLRERGSRLVLRRGEAGRVVPDLVRETGATAVYWNRRYEPWAVGRDGAIKRRLIKEGIEVKRFNGCLLYEPHAVRNKSGGPYKVFTPFWKACLQRETPEPLGLGDTRLRSPNRWPSSPGLDAFALEPRANRAAEFPHWWSPGEAGARERLERFWESGLADYATERDFPARDGVSRLSPHLRFGEIGPRRLVAKAGSGSGADAFLRELGWREFACHLLYHFPETTDKPLRPEFAEFRWRQDKPGWSAWTRGRTGYPIVDAGMRQLWRTGWLHNRVRMTVGSFLVKDLLIPWRDGARWFWDTLVDADLANNTLGWQWVAGCGADAAPYFRIFNPVLQGRKFDPRGEYVRRWVPELKLVPDKWIQNPWQAPNTVLEEAGVVLGRDYPRPIVDHAEGRRRALKAYDLIKGSSGAAGA